MSATASVTQEFCTVPVESIWPSPTNPRKRINEKSLAELAASIASHGVLQPILVRLSEMADGTFEIVAGERRWRAARLAGVKEVPVRIRELDDRAVAEIQTIENLQREDVHPLEEAAGFEALITNFAYTPQHIAEKIGCHESYVHKRLRLAKLIPPAREAFAGDGLTLNHAILIARLEPDAQRQALELCWQEAWDPGSGKRTKNLVPAKALDSRIREQIFLDLSTAPWKRDDAQLLPKAGPCTECPKRTAANGMLFDDAGKKSDHCLDRSCFEAKREAFVQLKIAAAAAEGKPIVRVSTTYADEKTLKKLDAVREFTFTKVTKKDRCAHAETAIIVHGQDIGQTFEICREAKCKTHHPYGTGGRGCLRTPQLEAAERRRNLDGRIDALYRRVLWVRCYEAVKTVDLERKDFDMIVRYLLDRIGHDLRAEICKALGLEPKKNQYSTDYESPLLRLYAELPDDQAPSFLLAVTLARGFEGWAGGSKDTEKFAREQLHLNPAAIRKEVAAPLLAKFEKSEKSRKAKAADEKKAARKAAAR